MDQLMNTVVLQMPKSPKNKVNRDTELTTAITQPFNTSPKQPPSPLLRGNTKLCTVGQIHNWSY